MAAVTAKTAPEGFGRRPPWASKYPPLLTLVAGPRLGPTNIEKGFRAIPHIASKNPQLAACFYEPGDYTCVKDGIVERWDPEAENQDGCYRLTEGGKRYLAGTWPAGGVTAQEKPTDPCNQYDDANYSNNGAPNPENPE